MKSIKLKRLASAKAEQKRIKMERDDDIMDILCWVTSIPVKLMWRDTREFEKYLFENLKLRKSQ